MGTFAGRYGARCADCGVVRDYHRFDGDHEYEAPAPEPVIVTIERYDPTDIIDDDGGAMAWPYMEHA